MFIAFISFSVPWLAAVLSMLAAAPFVLGITTGKGNTYALATLDAWLGGTALTIPGTWYAALFTTDPTDDDGTSLVEVTGGGYARISVTNNSTNFPNASVVSHVATKSTGTAIDWGTASGANWGTIVGAGFFSASSSGNLGYWGPLSASKTVNDGDGFKVNAGNGVFTES